MEQSKMRISKKKGLCFGSALLLGAYGLIALNFHRSSTSLSSLSHQSTSISQNAINRLMPVTRKKSHDHECFSSSLKLKNISVTEYIEYLNARVLRPLQPSVYKKPIQNDVPSDRSTTFNYDKTLLMQKLGNIWQWAFVRKRIEANWDALVQAIKDSLSKDLIPEKSTKRRVLVIPGVLELTDFAKVFATGGVSPLGELVQWSDLIAGLYILGHDIELQHNVQAANNVITTHSMKSKLNSKTGCGGVDTDFDYIYTDLLAHGMLSKTVQNTYRYKFRILDLFGTEQAYNNVFYLRKKGRKGGSYGERDLHLKQFYTIFPQTPDNSYLGCMIFNSTVPKNKTRHIAYLYGKQPELLKGRNEPSQIIPILQKYTEVHSSFVTMPRELLPYKLVNHGHLNPTEYQKLAQQTKVMIGLGAPEEGPGFLEAIAKGCVVINPSKSCNFKHPGKPTNRTFTSQNPYTEKFIGPPYVFTVDYSNTRLLEEVVKFALKSQVEPFTPFELTPGGFLQRLYTLVEHQDWCAANKVLWPPLSSMKVLVGSKSQSCNEVCEDQGLVCENLHFPAINNRTVFKHHNINCKTEVFKDELYAPSYFPKTSTCVFQKAQDLFSCASYDGPDPEIQRLCPCRDFIKYQVHMCRTC